MELSDEIEGGRGEEPRPRLLAGSPSPAWFRQVTWNGLLASLCPLIPLPFLDDWALGWVRRTAVADALRPTLAAPADWQLEILAGERRPWFRSGCLLGALVAVPVKLVVYLAKKLFRKLVIVLAVKDAVDKFSTLFHESYLLELARGRGLLDPASLASREQVVALRAAIDRATAEIDPRPVEQLVDRALRGSRRLLGEAARLLGRFLRPHRRRRLAPSPDSRAGLEREEEGLLGELLDHLMDALWNEHGYRAELEAAFDRALAAVEPAPSSAESHTPPA